MSSIRMKIYGPPFLLDPASVKAFLRTVVIRVCKVRGSNNHCRWRLFGTAAASDIGKNDGSRKRVSIEERKAMVESYVSKYRASNAGKFPTASNAQKEVGGAYYTIRRIMQELVYNSKRISNDRGKNALPGGLHEDNHISTSIQEDSDCKLTSGRTGASLLTNDNDGAVDDVGSSSQHIGDIIREENLLAPGEIPGTLMTIKPTDTGSNQLSAEHLGSSQRTVAPQSSSHLVETKDHADSRGTVEPETSDTKSIFGECSSNKVAAEDSPNSQRMVEHEVSGIKSSRDQSSSHADPLQRDSSVKSSDDDERWKKSSLWGTLKSLADNFLSMWRKQ
ncbi:hypothetical protein Dimus_026864 [Dionaea muscipula]